MKLQQRRGMQLSLGTVCVLMIIGFYGSYKLALLRVANNIQEQSQERTALKALNLQLQNENKTLKDNVMGLQRNYQIQVAAKENMLNHFKEVQEQNAQLMRDMALYQTIAGSPSASKELQIKAFQVFNADKPRTFRYLLVLAKQSLPGKFAEGAVAMTIVGRLKGNPVNLPVKYVDSLRNDGLAFKFRHFQELTGELSFPEDFTPETVLFDVNPDQEWAQFHQRFPWAAEVG